MHLRPPHPLDAQVVGVLLALVVVGLAWLVQDSRLTYGEALTLFAAIAAAGWGLTTLLLAGLSVVNGW